MQTNAHTQKSGISNEINMSGNFNTKRKYL